MNQTHITHPFTLDADKFNNNCILVKDDPMFVKNDQALLTNKGTREQKVKYIAAKHTDKVVKGYCYLELSDTRWVDDVPEIVGGQSMEHKANEA